jgi:NADPH:quinone reductase-like Zn-dependent oxidoreductase
LRSIGADKVFDYRKKDFVKSGIPFDVVFDVAGKGSFSRGIKSLKPGGHYLAANPRISHMLRGPWISMRSGKKVIGGTVDYKSEDLIFLKELIEAGKIKPVIDRRYPLARTAEAHRYVESGQKKGNVVITVEHSDIAREYSAGCRGRTETG